MSRQSETRWTNPKMLGSMSYSCSNLAQFVGATQKCFAQSENPFKEQDWCSAMSKWLSKYYFRWNEKQNQKTEFWLDPRPLVNSSSKLITRLLYHCSQAPTLSSSSLCLSYWCTPNLLPHVLPLCFSSRPYFPTSTSLCFISSLPFHIPLSLTLNQSLPPVFTLSSHPPSAAVHRNSFQPPCLPYRIRFFVKCHALPDTSGNHQYRQRF